MKELTNESDVAEAPEGAGDLRRDESGATTLEWALLLATIGIPSFYVIRLAMETLVGHYQMMTTVNSLPFP
ncbi:MAG: hypothetical protein GC159_11265 [Phycisphaera sp.]|nr:hypothetical protein [Phycisphaera sp.]